MAKRGNPNWRKGGPSPNPSGKSKPEVIRKDGATLTRGDGWYSATTGLGVSGRDKRFATGFCSPIVTPQDADNYWRGNDLCARIIETLPNEMLRAGWDICIKSEDTPASTQQPTENADAYDSGKDLAEEVAAKWEDLGLAESLHRALCLKRAHGGSAIFLGAMDGGTPDKPLNLDRLRSFDWLTVLETREIQPRYYYTNPLAPKFGEPEIYQVNPISPGAAANAAATQQNILIHESRLLVFDGIRTSRSLLGSDGWGDSVLTRCIRILEDFDLSWAAATVLLQDFAQAIYKIKGLAELFVNDQDDVVKERIKMVDHMRSTARAILIDAEEEFERKQTPISGLPEMLDRLVIRLCAAADMPRTRLFGESPGGLGSNGESETRQWYDRIDNERNRYIRPVLEQLAPITFRALGKSEPDQWTIKFRPLWQPTELEQAQARKAQADTDSVYITNGVLSPEEVARSRFGGDGYSFETTVDFDARLLGEPAAEGPAQTAAQIAQQEAEAEAKAAALEAATANDPQINR